MPECAYKLIAPDRAERLAAHKAAETEWFKNAEDTVEAMFGVRRRVVFVLDTLKMTLLGFEAIREPLTDDNRWNRPYIIPDGWMLKDPSRGEPRIVPKRNSKAGKELYAALHCGEKFPTYLAAFGGMPEVAMVKEDPHTWFHPAWMIWLDEGEMFVTWNCDPDRSDGGWSKVTEVDPKVWERIPLSEYYAALEARDKAKADA